eukprot:CAMPEP_0178378994 /NCGR_PEP_ID=MMETSP0689_2-20121128/4712_1 /TAXON_ID=160604 /ORGANISM="Amphidinium massartii, Strain CS-259" /LENGTH=1290 /DNA_ID=CAMNT_0019999079 /DNA_START=26 /DNA_END=3898 /DNA_ORIENTATION=+
MDLDIASVASPMGVKTGTNAATSVLSGQKVPSRRITTKSPPGPGHADAAEPLTDKTVPNLKRGRRKSAPKAEAAAKKAPRLEVASGGLHGPSIPAPRAESVAQLRELLEVLSSTRQGDAEEGLESRVQELASPGLSEVSAPEVRLLTARCLSEAFRVFAPEPPLQAEQLEASVSLFLEQLSLLSQVGAGEASDRLALLQRLVEVKAFVLIFECGDPAALTLELVMLSLKVARSGDKHSAVGLLSQAVASVLQDAEDIPAQVLRVLLDALLPNRSEESKVRMLVHSILAPLATKSAAAAVNEYLSACLQQEDDSGSKEGKRKHLLDLAAAFEVVSEVYKIDTHLCSRVMPLLQASLEATSVQRRTQATQASGRILAQIPSAGDPRAALVTADPIFFERFLERASDAEDSVRLAALDGCEALLLTAASRKLAAQPLGNAASSSSQVLDAAVAEVLKVIDARALDPHEALRARVVQLAESVAGSVVGLQLLAPQLQSILRRMLDKRPRVREASLHAAAVIYGTHVLPAWTSGDSEAALSLAWLPRRLCEAYTYFVAGKIGHTTQLEESMEQYLLGCGATYGTAQRARALAGLCSSVASDATALKGFTLLLGRKRDANRALQKFLRIRRQHAAPVLEAGPVASSALAVADPARPTDLADAASALQDLARLSPLMEERQPRTDLCLKLLRSFDAVRDKSLWETLCTLAMPETQATVTQAADLGKALAEMDRLLRVHRLSELTPVLRRALLTTWVQPELAGELLHLWQGDDTAELQAAAESALGVLPRYFPHAFLPHIGMVVSALAKCDASGTRSALRVLAAVGKHAASLPGVRGEDCRPALSRKIFVQALLQAVVRASAAVSDEELRADRAHEKGFEACRKAVRSLCHLAPEEEEVAVQEILQHAQDQLLEATNDSSLASAMRLATACFEWQAEALRLQRSDLQWAAEGHGTWVAAASKALEDGYIARPQSCMSAVCLLAAAGIETIVEVPKGLEDQRELEQYLVQTTLASLRGLRRATLPLTTKLLNHLAEQVVAIQGCSGNTDTMDQIIVVMQKFQQQTTCRMRMADLLRVSGTLPVTLAFSSLKRHREAGVRMLQAALAKAARRRVSEQETLLDYLVACFVHFLSHLDCLEEEADALLSQYKATTQVVSLLAEALVLCDEQAHTSEFAGAALRITERVRFFVDRERPQSELIQKAAQCLKYGVEKRCSDMRQLAAAMGQQRGSSSRGSMPAELFEAKTGTHSEGMPQLAGGVPAVAPRLSSPQALPPAPAAVCISPAKQIESFGGSDVAIQS